MNMNISDLFEELQNRFSPEDLNGELTLQGNCIVWSYVIEHDMEDEYQICDDDNNDDDSIGFDCVSSEELLQDAHIEDLEKIETFFDELNQANGWTFSDADIVENTISFKIF